MTVAAGDTQKVLTQITAGSFLDILPNGSTTGNEWAVTAVYGEAEFEIYVSDGTNSIKVRDAGMANIASLLDQLTWRSTTGVYYRLKNTGAASKRFGYDAVVTKP